MRKDPHTGEMFTPSRRNQKFANRKNQIDYNNAKARKRRESTKNLDQKLAKNRLILQKLLLEKNLINVYRNTLLTLGFDFGVFNRLLNKGNNQVYGIYEYYLLPIDENNFEIGKLQNNGTSN